MQLLSISQQNVILENEIVNEEIMNGSSLLGHAEITKLYVKAP